MICNIYVEWWNGSVSKWWQAIFHWCSRLKLFRWRNPCIVIFRFLLSSRRSCQWDPRLSEGRGGRRRRGSSVQILSSLGRLKCHTLLDQVHTLITPNSLWKPNWIWHSLKNSPIYICQCRSVNLSILRNINDQHDNVAIGETPFSTGYTWVTTLHKVIIVLTNNHHQLSYLVIHKTTASKLDGHWYLHWIFVILVAFKWVACPSIAFVARPFLYWWGAGHRQKPEDISWHRHSCRQRPRWGAGLQASGKVAAIKREMVGVQQLRVLCFLC